MAADSSKMAAIRLGLHETLYETDLDDVELRPFERLMLNKLDRLDSSLKSILESVSKIMNHVLKKNGYYWHYRCTQRYQ